MATINTNGDITKAVLTVLDGLRDKIASGEILPKDCIIKSIDPGTVWLNGVPTRLPVKSFVFSLEYLSTE